eukprot:1440794-Amphidinium_carterae.1
MRSSWNDKDGGRSGSEKADAKKDGTNDTSQCKGKKSRELRSEPKSRISLSGPTYKNPSNLRKVAALPSFEAFPDNRPLHVPVPILRTPEEKKRDVKQKVQVEYSVGRRKESKPPVMDRDERGRSPLKRKVRSRDQKRSRSSVRGSSTSPSAKRSKPLGRVEAWATEPV